MVSQQQFNVKTQPLVVDGAPAALAPLLSWASARLREQGAGAAASWRYERASEPAETLLHVTGHERGVCACIGRPNASRHIMVTHARLAEWPGVAKMLGSAVPARDGRRWVHQGAALARAVA